MKVYSCETGIYVPITLSGELGGRFKGAYGVIQSTLTWILRAGKYLNIFFLLQGLSSSSWCAVQVCIQLCSWMP